MFTNTNTCILRRSSAVQVHHHTSCVTGEHGAAVAAGHSADFATHFAETFGAPSSWRASPPGTEAVATSALANLLGGIGFFFGSSKVLYEKSKGQFEQATLKARARGTNIDDESRMKCAVMKWKGSK